MGKRGPSPIVLTPGSRYGRLIVVEFADSRVWPNGQQSSQHLCLCDCGRYKLARTSKLINGTLQSCGCLLKDRKGKMNPNFKHGFSPSSKPDPTYQAWVNMIYRCGNANSPDYHNYGARGIKVCDRWLNSFTSFLTDMGERPEGLTLDRINNEGDYEPSNCRWANWYVQVGNRRL